MFDPRVMFANPLFSGGFLLMVSGAAMALCRNIPNQMSAWFKKQAVVEVEVTSDDPIFEWISIWLNEHPYSKKTRHLIASSLSREYGDSPDDYGRTEPLVIFSPARGNHFFIYDKRLIWLHRGKEGEGGTSGNKTPTVSSSLRKTETYSIRVLGRKQAVIRALIEDARKIAKIVTASKLNIYICGGYGWNRLYSTTPRSLDTVILPKGEKDRLLNDIDVFMNRSEWYKQKGIPYRRGYLLWGLAGTGKTSVITALAGHLKMPLYVVSLGSMFMDDEKLIESFRMVPQKSIILLEDIDAVSKSRENKKREAVDDKEEKEEKKERTSLSGLLNCLDGVMAKDGCLVFMTTNYIHRLDSALIRPGRVDFRMQFDKADAYQIETMYGKFEQTAKTIDVGGCEKFVTKMLAEGATTAKAQEELMAKFE